jgi:MFS family permease
MTRWPTAGGLGWLLVICASRVGVYMVYIAHGATLPVLEREWHLSGIAAGSIASAFQVAYALSLMVCSELTDRVGARGVFLASSVGAAGAAVFFAPGLRGTTRTQGGRGGVNG